MDQVGMFAAPETRSCHRCHAVGLTDIDFYATHPEACRPCIRKAETARWSKESRAAWPEDRKKVWNDKRAIKSLKQNTKFSQRLSDERRAKHRKDPRNLMIDMAKRRAREKGLPFDLSASDLSVPEFCPVLGIPIRIGDRTVCESSPTLDRIVPAIGYVKGNVRVISFRANSLKRDATEKEIELILADLRAINARSK